MIHQPLGGARGQATEIEIHAREILKTRERLNKILAERTGQPLERIQHDTERDYFLSAQEAKDYGLVDQVLDKRRVILSADRQQAALSPSGSAAFSLLSFLLFFDVNKASAPMAEKKGSSSEKNLVLHLLRQEPARGQKADRWPVRLHL